MLDTKTCDKKEIFEVDDDGRDAKTAAFFLIKDIMAFKVMCVRSYQKNFLRQSLSTLEKKKRGDICTQNHCQELVWEVIHTIRYIFQKT